MRINITLYSYGFAWLTFSLFGLGLGFLWRNRSLSLYAIIATVVTAVWGAVVAVGTLMEYPPIALMQAAEACRNSAWIFLLLGMYGARLRGTNHIFAGRRWLPWFSAGLALMIIVLYAVPRMVEMLGYPDGVAQDVAFGLWLSFALVGLVLLEQIYQLSSESQRWSLKYLCLGLGFMFGYDFLMYTEALILRQLDPTLWQARGAAVGMTAPLLALSVLRSRKRTLDLQLSRHVVFHTFMLLAAGVYLVFMAFIAYAINVLGGTWGGVVQITFLSATGLFFVVLMLSDRVRDKLRVWLSKHFFSYRYDYRREWLEFTRTLAESGEATPRAVTEAMARLCNSPAGLLWMMRSDGRGFTLVEHWQMEAPDIPADLMPLARWLEKTEWIIDFNEWRESPELYEGLQVPRGIAEIPRAWLIVPLMFTDRLQGIILLRRSQVPPDMNWEDRDLLKVAGRAAATHLSRYQAHNSLVELRQFEAFNRLSAYVVHDLKNILAQQSLIVSNATRYREDPEFLDDVFATIDDSVERMTRLMNQMRSGVRGADNATLDLVPFLESVVSTHTKLQPHPRLLSTSQSFQVEADREQLATVFGHFIQNAQEATEDQGRIAVRIVPQDDFVVVEVEDSGAGMDEAFIKDRLFKPFDTTKGLAGMGIGVVESRDYVRGLGGDVLVSSTPGVGSLFRIVLPCAQTSTIVNAVPEDVAVASR